MNFHIQFFPIHMKESDMQFLNLRQKPARLTVDQLALILGVQNHDVPILVAKKILHPLGRTRQNSVKYFALKNINEIADDPDKLEKMTVALMDYWRLKNSRRICKNSESSPNNTK